MNKKERENYKLLVEIAEAAMPYYCAYVEPPSLRWTKCGVCGLREEHEHDCPVKLAENKGLIK